jgi:hypothetical protein
MRVVRWVKSRRYEANFAAASRCECREVTTSTATTAIDRRSFAVLDVAGVAQLADDAEMGAQKTRRRSGIQRRNPC